MPARRRLGLRLGLQQQRLLLPLLVLQQQQQPQQLQQQLPTGCPTCIISCSSSSWDLVASLPRITAVAVLLPCPLLVLHLLRLLLQQLLHLPVPVQ